MVIKSVLAAAVLAASSFAANAATVVFEDTTYEVSTITGSFTDNSAELMSQLWWGDRSIAETFAESAAIEPEPFYAWGPGRDNPIAVVVFDPQFRDFVQEASFFLDSVRDWAVATEVPPVSEVPLPAGGLLVLTGLGGLAVFKRRKNRAAKL